MTVIVILVVSGALLLGAAWGVYGTLSEAVGLLIAITLDGIPEYLALGVALSRGVARYFVTDQEFCRWRSDCFSSNQGLP